MAGSERKILIVDDDVPSVRSARAQLHYLYPRMQVFSAFDAGDGLALAETQRPDLIILDHYLPAFSGKRFLELLRGRPWGGLLPVLVWSASSCDPIYTGEQPLAFLKKPVSLERFAATLTQLIQKTKRQERLFIECCRLGALTLQRLKGNGFRSGETALA